MTFLEGATGDIITINLKNWSKAFFVSKTLSNILHDGWTRLAQFFLIWTAGINPELHSTTKIPEFNWIRFHIFCVFVDDAEIT